MIKIFGYFHEYLIQDFFEIIELKFNSVNEYFKISKITKKLALVKNAKNFNYVFFIFLLIEQLTYCFIKVYNILLILKTLFFLA